MKSTIGSASSWLRSISRERRTALISLMCLVALLGSLVAYRRFASNGRTPPDAAGAPLGADAGVTAAPGVSAAEAPPAPAQPVALSQPLAGVRKVLQPYEMAYSEAYADFRLHEGVDYEAAFGEPVLAAAAGRVVSIEEDPADGKVLTLDHGSGLTTRYAGLREVAVGVNATVRGGDTLAHVGEPAPARSKVGTHLHFEVLLNGGPVDPVSYLSK